MKKITLVISVVPINYYGYRNLYIINESSSINQTKNYWRIQIIVVLKLIICKISQCDKTVLSVSMYVFEGGLFLILFHFEIKICLSWKFKMLYWLKLLVDVACCVHLDIARRTITTSLYVIIESSWVFKILINLCLKLTVSII